MADNITKPVQGQAYVEFELKLPKRTLSYASLRSVPEIHEIKETVFGYNEAVLGFRVTDHAFINQILKALDSDGNPLVRWRMGLGNPPSIQWTPWQLYYVFQHSAMFEGTGTASGFYVKLTARDLLHWVDRSSRTRAHRGTISAIVQRLASGNSLADTVIEETKGDALWVQSFEGDFEFVRKRLLARARSKQGHGNYYLYIRDNVVHFHTLEYQTQVKDFGYYASPAIRLEAIDTAQAKIDIGSAGVRVVYHDPYTGQSHETQSDPDQAIRLANSIPRLDKVEGTQRNICEHRIIGRDESAGSTALAQNVYESARTECFLLKLQTTKTPFLRPGEVLRINIDPSTGTTSTWSGPYLVATASHVFNKGELSSVYILQRGEQRVARTSNDSLAAYGVETLEAEQNAPGYDINLREAQASSVTKGAGSKVGDGTYLTVQDKNKAVIPAVKLPT